MALNTDQKASKLFKKLQGVAETTLVKQFFEEAYQGRVSIFHDQQIWNQSELIPISAPILSDGQTDGVVQYFEDLILNSVPGLSNAFYHDSLKDSIPFNYGDGSYNYFLKDSNNNQIPFGMGDWVVDTEAGVLTFYSSIPANMPPKISFYKYVGTKGVSSGSSTPYIKRKDRFVVDNTIIANHYIDLHYNINVNMHEIVLLNGVVLEEGSSFDYTYSNNRVTFNPSIELTVNDVIVVKYYS